MRGRNRAWAAFAAGVVGLLAGLALDRELFWTDDAFLVLLALPAGLLTAGLCYWALGRGHPDCGPKAPMSTSVQQAGCVTE